ncbi:serine-type D-Ala-D-Ala carboxypeptidase [Bordetella tumbae]|uniref:D-alanyl-D-alanine carboxypeptidase family protein n=1 Tax=Bordetella tumbae TaxID=1649139 RepID=UPI0039EFEA46
MFKKVCASWLLVAACVAGVPAQAAAVVPPPVTAKAWLLLDATSGQEIASFNPDTRIEPASLTKVMTAYLVFQALRDGRLSAQQQVTVSTRAWKVAPGSSKMFLEPGKRVSIDDLLYGLLVQSGNDAAIALAEATSGSVEAFVQRMNEQAGKMGLHGTRFASPHGLPDPNTYSTARDLSVLAQRLVSDFPDLYRTYDSVRTFTYNNISQSNRNRLLWLDPSVDGLKTGHTDSAGYCLIASAERPDGQMRRRLISVVLGTGSDKLRTQDSQVLLNWGFQSFKTVKLYAKGEAVDTPQVWKGEQDAVRIGLARDAYVTVPRASEVKPVVTQQQPLVAPIAAQAEVGSLQVLVDGRPAGQWPVVALDAVPQAGIMARTWDTVRLWWRQTMG